jgi:hypothetical protein
MIENKIEAVRLLNVYTANRPQLFTWRLTGNAKRSCRNHILSVLLGEKVKCGQDGITRLRDEFFKSFDVNPNQCMNAQEEELMIKIK